MTDDDKALVERLRDFVIAEDIDAAADRIEAQAAEIKAILDREADTYRRHDAKIDALEAEIARKDEALRECRRAVSGGREEPRRRVRDIVDLTLRKPAALGEKP